MPIGSMSDSARPSESTKASIAGESARNSSTSGIDDVSPAQKSNDSSSSGDVRAGALDTDLECVRLAGELVFAGGGNRETVDDHRALVAIAIHVKLAIRDRELEGRRLRDRRLRLVEEQRGVALQGRRLAGIERPDHARHVERLEAVEHQVERRFG